MSLLETRKNLARSWFETLQTRIIAAFEAIEAEAAGPFGDEKAPGRFDIRPWERVDHSGCLLYTSRCV